MLITTTSRYNVFQRCKAGSLSHKSGRQGAKNKIQQLLKESSNKQSLVKIKTKVLHIHPSIHPLCVTAGVTGSRSAGAYTS